MSSKIEIYSKFNCVIIVKVQKLGEDTNLNTQKRCLVKTLKQ